ncbi:Cilia- and flagella-associated protein 45 [Trebouxia sp. C0009 RCD-2024]
MAADKKASPVKATKSPTSKLTTNTALQPIQADTVTIRRRDIERMRQPAGVLSSEEIARLKHEAEAELEGQRAVAQARKEKMLKMEEERRKHEPPTETERLHAVANSHTRNRADDLLTEQRDEVKHMNQMIQEKKHMLQEEEEDERALDLQMEIDRLRALEAYEERERQRLAESRVGAQILNEQIVERKRERVHQEELRDLERDHMTGEVERLKAEEAQAAQDKKRAAEALMAEVHRSNAEQMARKKAAKAAELEEDALIVEYLRQRQLKEQAALEEKARIAKEKELETASLRAKQERAADRQAEIDELRARRYTEAYEREWRQKEKAAHERVAATNRDLAQARAAQQAARVAAQADMARLEAQEFHRIVEENRHIEQQQLQKEMTAMQLREHHKEELRAQMAANEERQKRQHAEYLLEGEKTRQKLQAEKAFIEAVRQKKLAEMEAEGIPAKYRAELARKKMTNW